jgi:hypothetical protein
LLSKFAQYFSQIFPQIAIYGLLTIFRYPHHLIPVNVKLCESPGKAGGLPIGGAWGGMGTPMQLRVSMLFGT